MPARSGRLEKRTRLALPVQISSLQYPTATEPTTTENVSSLGIRVLSQRPRVPDERLMIKSLDWRFAYLGARCLLRAAPGRTLWYRITVPRTGRQLVKKLVGWCRQLSCGHGEISAPPKAQLRRKTEHLKISDAKLPVQVFSDLRALRRWPLGDLGPFRHSVTDLI